MRRFAILLPALLAWAAPSMAAGRPSIVLVTLDTVRADRMGFLGSTRGLSPNLDALAAGSVVFERAFAQAPMTLVSHATLLSGTYPQRHGVDDFGIPLAASVPYLPALLKQAGYRTAAFVGSLILEPRGGPAAGFDRGFDTYDAGFRLRRGGEDRYHSIERRAVEVVDRAARWLDRSGQAPFLLWVHLFDAHAPYEPPARFAARYRAAPYDGEVAYVDHAVGRLVEALRARRLFQDALVVVAADHGEGLGDHGEDTHGVLLYDATIRVPLLVKLPGARAAGARVNARVRLVDVAPTMLSVAGVPLPAEIQGESLLPLIGHAAADRAAYSETSYPRRAFGWSALASWRSDRFLYVEAPRRELYDLAADPAASRNLATSRGVLAERLSKDLASFRRSTAPASEAAVKPALDPATVERLASLGYASTGSARGGPGADPKDQVVLANGVHAAMAAAENGQPGRAAALLSKVVAKDPSMPLAQLQLGIALSRQKRYEAALAPLRRAIELDPGALLAHYEMGSALLQTGKSATALEHFQLVVDAMPEFADARFALASAQARTQQLKEAAGNLRRVLAASPRHFQANLLLGRVLTVAGQFQDALGYLQRAVEIEPDSSEARNFLADDYEQLGRGSDAQRERIRAQQLEKKPAP